MSAAGHENVRTSVNQLIIEIAGRVLERLEKELEKERKTEVSLLRKLIRSGVPLLVQHEVYVAPGKRERVDAVFGRRVVLEFKSEPGEFEEGVRKAREEYLPQPRFENARYFIVTNYELWRIYEVKRVKGRIELKPLAPGDQPREAVEGDLESQVVPEALGDFTQLIPVHPDSVEKLFKEGAEELVKSIRDAFRVVRDDPRVRPLYSAYTSIMRMLYGEAGDEFFEDLFARHTLMHMIALASLARALGASGKNEDLCSGVFRVEDFNVDVALPYLNWWTVVYQDRKYDEVRRALSNVVKDVVLRVNLLDWEHAESEDVFRILYEVLLDRETRRRLGEYYTPLWMVEYILNEFDLRGRVVLDPFCGSGTFLVMAFHRKVDKGEKPDEAYSELVGFDVNPLAVAIARAELILAYKRRAGRAPSSPPRIYHTDTLGAWFAERRKEGVVDPELRTLYDSAAFFLNCLPGAVKEAVGDVFEALKSLAAIEEALTCALNSSTLECKPREGEEFRKCLVEEVKRVVEEYAKERADLRLLKLFLEHAERARLYEKLADLVVKYGGNSVWALVLMSVYAPLVISRMRAHVVVTNPPWITMSELGGGPRTKKARGSRVPYADEIREKARELVKTALGLDKRGASSVVTGSDVACMALYRALGTAEEGVGFVMSRKQSFYHRSSMRAGILLTYSILRDWEGSLKLVDVDFDAFEHGVYPAIVIAKRGERKREFFVARLSKDNQGKDNKNRYSKSLRLAEVPLKLEKLDTDYDGYIRLSLAYFKENLGVLAGELSAIEVAKQGLFIRGLFGGEEGQHAGLVLLGWEDLGRKLKFRLYNTESTLEAYKEWVAKYEVGVYDMVYYGDINPFGISRLYNVLLSSKGGEELREFLERALKISRVIQDDIGKIRRLIEELQQGKVVTLKSGQHYVVYRGKRVFVASVFVPQNDRTVVGSEVSYMLLDSPEKAHYYAGVLNYLAYKAIEKGRPLIRDQYARPLPAIIESGLRWDEVKEETRKKVAELSKKISESDVVKREFGRKDEALLTLKEKCPKFQELVEVLDSAVDPARLEEALELVSEAPEASASSEED